MVCMFSDFWLLPLFLSFYPKCKGKFRGLKQHFQSKMMKFHRVLRTGEAVQWLSSFTINGKNYVSFWPGFWIWPYNFYSTDILSHLHPQGFSLGLPWYHHATFFTIHIHICEIFFMSLLLASGKKWVNGLLPFLLAFLLRECWPSFWCVFRQMSHGGTG